MKILHIIASYEPAYIYGGPMMSVAKLCQELNKAENFRLKAESRNKEMEIEPSFEYRIANNKEEENKGLREPQPDKEKAGKN